MCKMLKCHIESHLKISLEFSNVGNFVKIVVNALKYELE